MFANPSLQNKLSSKEFKINKYMKLKLENRRTIIYVNNRPFRQCMYLLLNIQVDKIKEYDEINSIDEAASKLDRKMERNHNIIPPETEFWGHCSNLQAWADNNYDTRILHRNLAFPLLKALADAGDPIAKSRFKEEIAIRYATGHPTVVRFLTQNGYLYYLTEEEFESVLVDIDFPTIDEYSRKIIAFLENFDDRDAINNAKRTTTKFLANFRFAYKYLILIKAMDKIPLEFRRMYVEFIYNKYKNYRAFPLLKFLNKAQINYDELEFELIKYQGNLIGFLIDTKLKLSNKMIENILTIDGINDIAESIEELDLGDNRITKIEGLENMKNLKKLNLKNNYIKKIEGIEELNKLETLDLSGNDIQEIPEFLAEMKSLKMLKLTNCRIGKFHDSVAQYFWMGQNYRYYTEYTQQDVEYYEKYHKSKAGTNDRLYKNFVKWLFKLKEQMNKHKFSHKDIQKFEMNGLGKAIPSGKPTNTFLKFLDDRYQLKITQFFENPN
ncbi:MAG: hypothetical protein EU516_01375 [Promethearchaeota archaeon]|nr:MAG: hypothetical protein EU516_01375 [Candidatus Lokiarchaeota archaeon]